MRALEVALERHHRVGLREDLRLIDRSPRGRASITAASALPAPVTLLRRTDDFERFATVG